jgi:hypothetical protein
VQFPDPRRPVLLQNRADAQRVGSFVLCLGEAPMETHGFLTFEVSHPPGRGSRQVLAMPPFEDGA